MAIGDHVSSLIKCAVMIALPVALFAYVTSYSSVHVPKEDLGMRSNKALNSAETFTVYPSIRRPKDLEAGDVVAFVAEKSGKKKTIRLARIMAIEGQRVAIKPQNKGPRIFVDGRKEVRWPEPGTIHGNISLPEFVVPQGHVYILFDNALLGGDSLTEGPLPWRRIVGKANVK